ncbi:E3 ubiquitin-protein ligase TRIM45-like [Crassostrea virginica]
MDPEKRAQDVLRCDVCSDKEREKSQAEVYCSTSHTNVCSPCVAKHMASNNSKKHDIVLLHSANTEVDMPNCPTHSAMKCELFCKKCNMPICLKCLTSNYNSHAVEEIIEM